MNIHSIDEGFFKTIDSPKKAFWLGFICADGSIYKVRNSLCFTITQKEKYLIERFSADVCSTYIITKVEKQKGRYGGSFFKITIYNQTFIENLLNAGKTYYKENLLSIPVMPDNLIKDFIRGYFEGDGSISFNISIKSWIVRVSGNQNLLTHFKNFISENLFSENKGYIGKDRTISFLSYGGNKSTKKLINYLYYSNDVEGIKANEFKKSFYHYLD